ncbi:T9SS type A sorting domain-containing protein [Candidatus Kapabacteria bacterium]|nr:T9SS type A sorting domain-containing protein [Candidatus Kapabacteria bacterium]
MQKLFTLLFLLSSICFSQSYYTAQEAYPSALGIAEGVLTNPVLSAIAVNNGLEIEITETTSFTVEFNESDGTANVFSYVFHEEGDKSLGIMIPIVKVFGTYQDAGSSSIPYEDFEDLITDHEISETWINSDEFVTILNQDEDHNQLKSSFGSPEISLIVLIPNGEPETPTTGETYWYVQYVDDEMNDLFFCITHAVTKEVACEEDEVETSIVDLNNGSSKVGPNPSIDTYSLEIDNVDFNTKVELIDIYGNIINSDFTIESNKIKINTSNLNLGTYIVKISNDNKNYVSKFIKSE